MRGHQRDTDVADLLDRALRFHRAARYDKAVKCYQQALAIDSRNAELWNNCGVALKEMGRLEDALGSYERALAINPNYAEAHNNRGNVLKQLGRLEDALASYDRALRVRPAYANAMIGRGMALQEFKRHEEALASYTNALAIQPSSALGFFARGTLLQEMGRRIQALRDYDQAVRYFPNYAEAYCNCGVLWREMGQYEKALAALQRALAISPDSAKALFNCGSVLLKMGRYEEARQAAEHALAIEPNNKYVLDVLVDIERHACDWARAGARTDTLIRQIEEGAAVPNPFTLLSAIDDPALQLQCARRWLGEEIPVAPAAMHGSQRWRIDKIRIAYVSPDLRQHPVGNQLVSAIERHDKARFETIAVSTRVRDGSETQARLIKAFDQFHDVFEYGDRDIAKLLSELRVDIAVDLAGHTGGGRPGIFAHRPAPIQVSYLGYSATTGADFIDYVIADKIVAPFEQQRFFTEKIVHLPDCYMVNDATEPIGATPTRAQAGLPDEGFVFCCFNSLYKLAAPVFEVWMRLLDAHAGSVLWLSHANDTAAGNLRREAARRGVDPSRLLFAPRLARMEDHLARHRLAGLFLDTLPYNAHVTARDALWSGLPVVTCCGRSFAARVAASLLHAVGLPDLVTYSLDDYEALAKRLAGDEILLSDYRRRLEENRLSSALFDTDKTVRHIETAYRQMVDIWQRGETPRNFAVPA